MGGIVCGIAGELKLVGVRGTLLFAKAKSSKNFYFVALRADL